MKAEAERRAGAERVASERLALAKQQEESLLQQIQSMQQQHEIELQAELEGTKAEMDRFRKQQETLLAQREHLERMKQQHDEEVVTMKKQHNEELTMLNVSLDGAHKDMAVLVQSLKEAKETQAALEQQVAAEAKGKQELPTVATPEVVVPTTAVKAPTEHLDGLVAAARVAKKLVRWTEEARATSRRIDELADQEAEEEARRANEHAALLKEHAEAERLRAEMEQAKADAARLRKEESDMLQAEAERELEELERQHEEEKRTLELQLQFERNKEVKEHVEVENLRLEMEQLRAEATRQHELEKQALLREHAEAEKFRKLAEDAQAKRDKERAQEAIKAAARARVELDALEQQHKAERKVMAEKKEQAKLQRKGTMMGGANVSTPAAMTSEADLLHQQLEELREKRVADLTMAFQQSAEIEALHAQVQELQQQLKECRAQLLRQSQFKVPDSAASTTPH
jgi:hypothetical protein